MKNVWIISLLLALVAFQVGCDQLPGLTKNADESIEVLSGNGTTATGHLVTVRNPDGTTRKMVILDRADSAPGSGARSAAGQAASYRSSRTATAYSHRKRSLEKSALIVGGSAGAGALIGGLAKGGKGAGIGALAGGL